MVSTKQLDYSQQQFIDQVQSICHSFGLYGNITFHQPSPVFGSNCNKVYLIAGRDSHIEADVLPDDFDPEYILRRNLRNERVIYTDYFVCELGSDCNYMGTVEKLIEYCKYTEFLMSIYKRFQLDPPMCLRRFEVRQLMDARETQRAGLSDRTWQRSTDMLNRFFEKERKQGIRKEWMSFFRSEKYPDDGSVLDKARAFRKRGNPIISLDQLMACNSQVHTLEMQEHEFRRFAEYMSSKLPFVPYAVSEKVIIDNQSSSTDPALEATCGKRITGEAFDKIVEDRFAEESWSCISQFRPCYFEVRKISYAAVDEPYVASAFQNAVLRYARCDTLFAIEQRGGSLQLVRIPKEDFMNFVSLAKANMLPFHIDMLGLFETPSLKKVNVIYSSFDEDLLRDILDRIVDEKIVYSHLVPEEERQTLQSLLQETTTVLIPEQNLSVQEHTDREMR